MHLQSHTWQKHNYYKTNKWAMLAGSLDKVIFWIPLMQCLFILLGKQYDCEQVSKQSMFIWKKNNFQQMKG